MKKITIVYERNEETNAIELRTIVIFDENKAPVVTDYKGVSSLVDAADFAIAHGYNVFEEANVLRAINDGLISVISRTNAKAMGELRAEIFQENLKHGISGLKEEKKAPTTNPVAKEEKPVTKTKKVTKVLLGEDDQQLADYFRLEEIRKNRELTKEELGYLIGLVRKNERVRALEEARTRLFNRERNMTQEQYDRLSAAYKAQLENAYKNAKTIEIEVPVEEEKKEEKVETVKKTVKVKQLDIAPEFREFVEYLKLIINRDSRELTDDEKERLETLVKTNKRAQILEAAKQRLINKTFTEIEYQRVHSILRAQLADAIKNAKYIEVEKEIEVPAEKDNKTLTKEPTSDKKEVTPIVEKPAVARPVITPIKDKEETKETNPIELKLSKEDTDLAEYFKLDLIKQSRDLTEDENKKFIEIVNRNEKAKKLEEARVLKDMYKARYDDLYNKYRAELADSFRKATVENKEKESKPIVFKKETDPRDKIISDLEVSEAKKTVKVTDDKKEVKESKDTTTVKETKDSKKELTEEIKREATKDDKKSTSIFTWHGKDKKDTKTDDKKETKTDDKKDTKSDDKKSTSIFTWHGKDKDKDKDKSKGIRVIKDTEVKNAKGVKPITDGKEETVDVPGKGKIKVKTTKWWKKLIAALTLLAIGALSALGIEAHLNDKNTNKTSNKTNKTPIVTEQVVPTPTRVIVDNRETTTPTLPPTSTQTNNTQTTQTTTTTTQTRTIQVPTIDSSTQARTPTYIPMRSAEEKAAETYSLAHKAVQTYCTNMRVPSATRAFLERAEVLQYISQFTNADQRAEVISALCYGYEANILTTEDGNFRLDKDGNNYLSSFTSDFLCAKVVVNGYSGTQMKKVFGNSDVSLDQILGGFENYCYTVSVYGMNATEPLPFRYLTNNNGTTTPMLESLMDKLIVVNANRENNTLTSQHTDDFIAEVYDFYITNNSATNQATKSVAGALVDSYILVQSNISNGEAMYLHENRGYARAGINLRESDGHLAIGMPDKTTYEFLSLFDVVNHGYGDKAENADRCLSEQETLLANITAMNLIDNPSPDAARLRLAVYLQENGLEAASRKVRENTFNSAYLYNLGVENPAIAPYINDYLFGDTKTQSNNLVNFENINSGVDRLVGVSGRSRNNYANLVNNRRDVTSRSYKVVSGNRYTSDPNKTTTRTTGKTTGTSTTTTTREQVTPDQMTAAEKQQAEEKTRQLQQEEAARNAAQEETVRTTLRAEVEAGASKEQVAAKAEELGVTDFNPNYSEELAALLAEQKVAEENKPNVEAQRRAEIEANNRRAEAEATARHEDEAQQQEAERLEQERLIQAGVSGQPQEEESKQATGDIQVDYHSEEDEEDYIPDSAAVKEQLEAMKRAALSLDVDLDSLDGPSGPRLG